MTLCPTKESTSQTFSRVGIPHVEGESSTSFIIARSSFIKFTFNNINLRVKTEMTPPSYKPVEIFDLHPYSWSV